MKKKSIMSPYEYFHLEFVSNKVELEKINHIIKSRSNTPIESYIELDIMLAILDRRRKKVK